MDSLSRRRASRASLIDIDSTTGREGEAGAWLAVAPARRSATPSSSSRSTDGRFNVLATLGSAGGRASRRTSIACRRSFRAAIEDDRLYGRGACDAKGILAAQIAAAERLRAAGERRVGLLFVVGEERGSDGATTANRSPPGSRVSRQRRADRQPARDSPRAASCACKLHARGRAAHSVAARAGRVGDREAARRAGAAADDGAAVGSACWSRRTTRVGLIEGGVAPNVVPAGGSGRDHVPDRRRRR